ncbi:YgaP family membrane protein [Pontibacillus salipaludis]|uniref:Inner membrane protein YgaP-like transmembrane domain-containing protein n=1 Tax=Pontibacillus salipaludis TaxID=1697394 RepID=A0ABQ1QDT8_9BACI|nr:DUF2892 domain-containing protein [Pontibacillus salipaludis]GGD22319.1 hypothetical protein GCM10011389_32570 [Pontibacillus salipaludis]
MVRPNIGIINAMIRITLGLTLLSFSTAKMVRKPWRDGNWMMIMLASMKVAEGIVRYCPVVAMMEETKNNQQDKEDEESTFNPS